MTIEHLEEKKRVLEENAKGAEMMTLDYINHSIHNDPGFFRWLFGPESSQYDDFVCPDLREFNLFFSQYLKLD